MNDTENSSQAEQNHIKKLYRSTQQRVIAGVCGGLAEYFGVDVVVVRLAWALFTLMGGAGIVLYVICWIIVPDGINQQAASAKPPKSGYGAIVLGIFLVIVGLSLIIGWSGSVAFGFPFTIIFAPIMSGLLSGILILIGLGLLLGWLLSRSRNAVDTASDNSASTDARIPGQTKRLYRARDFRVLAGICGGLGKYLNLDPTIVRILCILFAVASLGTALLIYVVMIFVIPEEPVS